MCIKKFLVWHQLMDDVPSEIANLNMYERLLTQRAKCFMNVIKLMPYNHISKQSQLVPAIRGIVTHLPMPMENIINRALSTLKSLLILCQTKQYYLAFIS